MRHRPFSAGFKVGFSAFFASLVVSGLVLAYIYDGDREQGLPVHLVIAGTVGYAFLPVAIAAVVGLFTFSEKKRPKTGVAKLTLPSLAYAFIWMLAALGSESHNAMQKGVDRTPASDASALLAAAGAFVLAMALVWVLPVIVYLLRGGPGLDRDSAEETAS